MAKNNIDFCVRKEKRGKLFIFYFFHLQHKTNEGGKHSARNAQFEKINERVKSFQEQGLPSISVDTKKKENIGNYANKGKEYHKKGQPEEVNVYDFINKELGKAAPYGIYDLFKNEGFVNVGISSDTAEFAVNSIRSWWDEMGKAEYPNATQLLITADCGGSNGYRVRLWKTELQKFADETGMIINVCHFPPGTSKWNKIEHRQAVTECKISDNDIPYIVDNSKFDPTYCVSLVPNSYSVTACRMFCCISQNWRGRPLITRETVVNLIGNTKTK